MNYIKFKLTTNKIRLVLLFLLIVIGFILFILLFRGDKENFFKDLFYEIFTGVVFTTLSIFMLGVFYWITDKKDLDDLHDKEMLTKIMDLMKGKGQDDNLICDVYNENAARQVMINSISYFNKWLAEPYAILISSETYVIRENFNYRINILKDDNILEVEQNLKYKRYFKPYGDSSYMMKCGFTFSTKYLGDSLFDSTFFMREEIHDDTLISKFSEIFAGDEYSKVLELLSFKSYFYTNDGGDEVPISEREAIVTPQIENGVVVGFKIETILPKDIFSKHDGFYSYTARVSFSIPHPKSNRFYCVFANPIIGKTHFNIRFPSKTAKVDYLEFLTMSGNKSRIHQRNSREWEFETTETIFPTSAIIWFWEDL